MKQSILIRVDGSSSIGIGHVVRCAALACAIGRRKIQPIIVTRSEDDSILKYFKKSRCKVVVIPKNYSVVKECQFIQKLSKSTRSSIILADINNFVTFPSLKSYQAFLRRLQNVPLFVATFEDIKDRPFPADLVIIPYFGAEKIKLIPSKKSKYLIGPKYYVFRDGFRATRRHIKKNARTILITMGGGDTQNFTIKVVRALARMNEPFSLIILIGHCANFSEGEIRRELKGYPGTYRVEVGSSEVAAWMCRADLCIMNSGLTKYEAALLGLPSIVISNSDRHARIMDEYAEYGSVLHLGNGTTVGEDDIRRAVASLSNDEDARSRMSRAGTRLLDDRGVRRIINELPI